MRRFSAAMVAVIGLLLAAPQLVGVAYGHEGGDREEGDPFAKERKQNLVDEFKIDIDGEKVEYIAVRTPDEGHVILVPKGVKRVPKGGGFLTGLLVPGDDRRASAVVGWAKDFALCMTMAIATDALTGPNGILPSPARALVSDMRYAWFVSLIVRGITGGYPGMGIVPSEELEELLGKSPGQPNPDQVQAACGNVSPPPEKVELVRNPNIAVENKQLVIKEGARSAPVKKVYILDEKGDVVKVEIDGVQRPATEEDKKAFNDAFEQWGEQMRQALAKSFGGDGGATSSSNLTVHASYRPGVAVRLKDGGYGLVIGAKINF